MTSCIQYDAMYVFVPPLTRGRQSTRMALTIPFAKKNCCATSFAVSGAIMWNDLHPQLRTITCLTSFKRELRKTLCSRDLASQLV